MISGILLKVAGMEKEARGKYAPRPSLAGPERCIRQMVMWSMDIPQDRAMADRFQMTIDDSIFHEYLTGDWIQKSAFKLHSAQMGIDVLTLDFIDANKKRYCKICDKDIPLNILHGHPDGILTDLLGVDRHYEHKALNHFTFNRYWAGQLPLDYITQCCLYIKGLKKLNPEISESVLLIKNKNTAQYIDYLIRYDATTDTAHIMEIEHSGGEKQISDLGLPLHSIQHIIRDAVDRFRLVNAYVALGELPERPYEIGTTFPCGYCSWEKTCWQGYEREYTSLEDDAVMTGEIETLVKYYFETNMHLSEMEKEKEKLKGQIKAFLKEQGIRQGRAGIYTINNQLQKRTVLDKEAIPTGILKSASKETFIEVLSIRKIKEDV